MEIAHRVVKTNGINLHIAELGSGPLVLLLHGFPECWFSWRHQIPVLANAGYHVVAPDLRGFGESDAPQGAENYTQFHIVGDLIGLLDVLGEDQAFVVGHDWGAVCAWNMCLFRPDRVRAVVAISVHFRPRLHEQARPLETWNRTIGEGFYMCRFQEPGRAEADFARHGVANVIKKFFLYSKKDLLIAPLDKEIMDIFDEPEDFPPWITSEEIQCFVDVFEKTGFTGGLSYYRAYDLTWELMAPWTGAKVLTPALYIGGSEDIGYNSPGVPKFIANQMKEFVPNLKAAVVLPGAHHFMQQEQPEAVNKHILDFLGGHL